MNEKLLQCFHDASGEYVSGEQLSRMLGVSRTAVWKRIKRLEEEGYIFDSSPRLGYRLIGIPERLDLVKLTGLLKDNPYASDIRWYESIRSTQDAAHEALLLGAGEGTLILAENQTGGRGRFGRAWHSPKGKGIYMSFLLQPNLPLQQASHMTILLSVALCRSIRKVAQVNATIKWPNDILINGAKVCGILVETFAEADRVKTMIAGIGISVNFGQDDFPEELRDLATSILLSTGRSVSREALIAEYFEQFSALYELYKKDGFAPIRSLWIALTSTLGGQVTVTTPQGVIRGKAEEITADGALYVRDDNGELHLLYSGDLKMNE